MRICLSVTTERLQLQTAACRGREPCKELLSLSARFAHLWSHPSCPSSSFPQLLHQRGTRPASRICFSSPVPLQLGSTNLKSWQPRVRCHTCLLQWMSEWCWRSYCICWHVCILCSLCLQKQKDVSLNITQWGDPKGQPTFGPHSEHCTSSCKPTLFYGRLWRLPNFAPPAFGFHWNESSCSHGCPNRSLPDQLWIKSNHQLIA